jgi:hypothetical protein
VVSAASADKQAVKGIEERFRLPLLVAQPFPLGSEYLSLYGILVAVSKKGIAVEAEIELVKAIRASGMAKCRMGFQGPDRAEFDIAQILRP